MNKPAPLQADPPPGELVRVLCSDNTTRAAKIMITREGPVWLTTGGKIWLHPPMPKIVGWRRSKKLRRLQASGVKLG